MAVEPTESNPGPISPALIALLGLVVLTIIAGFVVLSALGRDTLPYVLFTASGVPVAVVSWVLNHRVKVVEQLARVAVEQTNGKMTAEFIEVHEHLDGQTGILLAGLKEDPPAAVPARYKTSSSAAAGSGLPEQAPPSVRSEQAVDL